ncbi:hypothetical protein LCGC14_0351240 [marine sediment metagenome]|uniref:Uncharacterized protein n=1 Tax=marine sediment metagenome TaxID=412755 RepID=A0A0F9TAQ2_9ZZZZ
MTVLEMTLLLGDLMNDSTVAGTGEGNEWTAATKVRFLNRSQERFCALVVNDALSELQTIKSVSAMTSSGFAFSGLSAGNNYFRYVNAKNTTDNVFFTKIESGQVGQIDNSLATGEDDDPLCYIFKDTFFPIFTSGNRDVDIWYIRRPKTLVVSGASGGEAATCEINDMFHWHIVALAEAWMKSATKEFENASALIKTAFDEIALINQNYKVLESSDE